MGAHNDASESLVKILEKAGFENLLPHMKNELACSCNYRSASSAPAGVIDLQITTVMGKCTYKDEDHPYADCELGYVKDVAQNTKTHKPTEWASTIPKLFAEYTQVEHLEKHRCPSCKETTPPESVNSPSDDGSSSNRSSSNESITFTKRLSLSDDINQVSPSNYLCINLKRYNNNVRLSTKITINENEAFLMDGVQETYELKSVVCHKGGKSADAGHYVSYCKVENGFRCYDDTLGGPSAVTAFDEIAEIHTGAYILFYKRTTYNSPSPSEASTPSADSQSVEHSRRRLAASIRKLNGDKLALAGNITPLMRRLLESTIAQSEAHADDQQNQRISRRDRWNRSELETA